MNTEVKNEYEATKKEHDILIMDDNDAEEACHFVSKLIQVEINRMERDEPYATNSIARLKQAESEVYHMFDTIQEAIRGED